MQRMTRIDKNDVLRQYNDKCIMYSDIILSSVKLEKSQHSGETIATVM